MTVQRRHASTLQDRFEAASRRIDETACDMLSILEDEIQDSEYDALERVFRTRHTDVHADDDWWRSLARAHCGNPTGPQSVYATDNGASDDRGARIMVAMLGTVEDGRRAWEGKRGVMIASDFERAPVFAIVRPVNAREKLAQVQAWSGLGQS
jgi:hypothetical protein